MERRLFFCGFRVWFDFFDAAHRVVDVGEGSELVQVEPYRILENIDEHFSYRFRGLFPAVDGVDYVF